MSVAVARARRGRHARGAQEPRAGATGTRAAAAAGLLLLFGALSCARTPPTPPALVAAHAALLRAQLGPAREHAPAQVARAEVGFARARATCAQDPGASSCRDWCYVVERRAQRACAEADVALAHRIHQRAHLALAAGRARQLGAQPPAPGAQLGLAPARPGLSGPSFADPPSQEDQAVQRALRQNAPQARAVYAQDRGLVVRLRGERAFAPGTDRLQPSARLALQQVARALREVPVGRLTVGARADADDTRDLARARAHATVAHLIACGLAATQLRAEVLAPRPPPPAADRHDVQGADGARQPASGPRPSGLAAASGTDDDAGGEPDGDGHRGRDDEIELVWRLGDTAP